MNLNFIQETQKTEKVVTSVGQDSERAAQAVSEKTVASEGEASSKLEQTASNWGKGTFDSPSDSLQKHFEKHGAEVGAENVKQYANKANEFAKKLSRAKVSEIKGATPDVYRYSKNGKYLDLQITTKKIISFGSTK